MAVGLKALQKSANNWGPKAVALLTSSGSASLMRRRGHALSQITEGFSFPKAAG